MFLFYIVINTILLSLTYALSPFSSYDCILGSEFQAAKCSWTLTDKYSLSEEGLTISSDATNRQKLLQTNTDVIPLLTSSTISPNLIKNSLTCSVEISLFSDTGFDGYQLNWLLSEQQTGNNPPQNIDEIESGLFNKWSIKRINIRRPKNPFQLTLELLRSDRTQPKPNGKWSLHIREVRLVGCSRDSAHENCSLTCDNDNKCITRDEICDVTQQCLDGLDEKNCTDLPNGAYLLFSNGNLDDFGWSNNGNNKWLLKDGSVNSWFTGTSNEAIMISPIFQPINSLHRKKDSSLFATCKLRFLLWSDISVELMVHAQELEDKSIQPYRMRRIHHEIDKFQIKKTHDIYRHFQKPETHWTFVSNSLPLDLFGWYRLEFNAKPSILHKPMPGKSNSIRIANLSLSRECFGEGTVPDKPNYFELRLPLFSAGIKGFRFNSCGRSGKDAPEADDCSEFYGQNSTTQIKNGVQMWQVPKTGFYSIFLAGASGGSSYHLHGGKGAFIRAVVHLEEKERLIMLVGQAGESSCLKQSYQGDHNKICDQEAFSSGGGGGGATYIFVANSSGLDNKANNLPLSNLTEKNLLLIAAGGGGDGTIKTLIESIGEDGLLFDQFLKADHTLSNLTLNWSSHTLNLERFLNRTDDHSICKGQNQRAGGFPGGLNSCNGNGGSGDGYHRRPSFKNFGGPGGTSWFNEDRVHLFDFASKSFTNEEYNFATGKASNLMNSFKNNQSLKQRTGSTVESTDQQFNGFVVIYSAIENCCREKYPCVVVNVDELGNNKFYCACSQSWFEPNRPGACAFRYTVIVLGVIAGILIVALIISGYYAHKQYKYQIQKKLNRQRHFIPYEMDEYSVFRVNNIGPDGFTIESNPNYMLYKRDRTEALKKSLKHLNQIALKDIAIGHKLGQGAFGEVHFATQLVAREKDENGKYVDIRRPVAVKTLYKQSTDVDPSEIKFIMEALIMTKYNHRNIVKLIGVSLDSNPQLIILELSSRAANSKPGYLNMGDLLVFALDIARGLEYLESLKFTHRDIAARNCLLTSRVKSDEAIRLFESKTPAPKVFNIHDYDYGYNRSGIVAKIADFGLTKDVYENDYYKTGKRNMIPIRWMPPEAINEGKFSTKTDVWSFGILMWEIFSGGFQPYTGRSHSEIIASVTDNIKIERPNSDTPDEIYNFILSCLEPEAAHRPSCSSIIKGLGELLINEELLYRQPIRFSTKQVGGVQDESKKDIMVLPKFPTESAFLVPLIDDSKCGSTKSKPNESAETANQGGTCSTTITVVDDSIQSKTNSLNARSNGAIQNGISMNRPVARRQPNRRQSKSIPECDEEQQQKLEEREKLNQQLNEQFDKQLTEQLNDQNRLAGIIIKKISVGNNLDKLSAIFRKKERMDGGTCQATTKYKQAIKRHLFNKNRVGRKVNCKQIKLKDQIGGKKVSNQLSSNRIGKKLILPSTSQPTTNQTNTSNSTTNSNDELILNAGVLNSKSIESTIV